MRFPLPGRRPARVTVGVLVLLALGLTGCGSVDGAPGSARSSQPAPKSAAQAPAAKRHTLGRSHPVEIVISKIGVRAPIMTLGLKRDGSIEEPPLSKPNLTGWYRLGPTPGQKGPAVIAGHVDAHGSPAVFAKLGRLSRGDRVEITRKDGTVAVFQIDSTQRVPKNAFPTKKVYGDIAFPGLRLITCGGAFNTATGHYVDNVIAYGHLVSSRA
jgi:hypothetical protein